LEELLKQALKKADQAEIYRESEAGVLFKSVLDRVESCDSFFSEGYGLRIVRGGRLGFSYFTQPSEFGRALRDALQSAKFSKKLDVSFPPRQRYAKAAGLYSRRLAGIGEQEICDSLLQMVDAVKRRITPVQSFISRSETHGTILNSEGCSFEEQGTLLEASSIAQFRESRQYEFRNSRDWFDCTGVAREAALLARRLAGGKPVSGRLEIALHPKTVVQLLEEVFMPAINGERVFRKKSYFADRLGSQVASPGISIKDDPLRPAGVASAACDDDGVATRTKAIIEDGVLKTFLHGLESAALASAKTTGNGFRHSFASMPSIEGTNIVATAKDRQELSDFNGLMVYDLLAVHNANPVTGDFAVDVASGAMMKRGELKSSVRGCSLSGNFFELLRTMRLGDDEANYGGYYGPSWIYTGSVV
jgi:PmbA protein